MLPRPTWADPRVHLLDDVWLLTIAAILIATGVPWFLSGFEVQLGAASWGLLVLGAVHWAFTSIAAPTRAHTRWHARYSPPSLKQLSATLHSCALAALATLLMRSSKQVSICARLSQSRPLLLCWLNISSDSKN